MKPMVFSSGVVARAQRHHRADQHDAVHEVRAGHQRRVQDHRHLRDDLVAGECGQHENVERDDPGHVALHQLARRFVFDGAGVRQAGLREHLVLPVDRERGPSCLSSAGFRKL